MIKVSPSLLAADFSRLSEEVKSIESSGADMLHLDVMDGVFVTNISFGFPVIDSIRKISTIDFDVHLMIDKPERYAKRFIEAGANILTFHFEATDKPAELLDEIRALGAKAAISVKPATAVERIFSLLDKCDMVLIMTVEPGYGGQKFMPEMLPKIQALRHEIIARGLDVDIQVDGGIAPDNAADVIAAGANVIVAGSSVFKAEDRAAAVKMLRG